MKILKQITLSILGLIAMLAAMPASAADVDDLDVKIYPGAMCGATNATDGISHWRGRAYNNRTDLDIWVNCPVIRDVVGASGRIVSAWFKVVDQHYSEDASCGLWSQNSDSNDGWAGNYISRTSSGSGNTPYTMNFTSLNAFSNSAFYVFECQIPNVYMGNTSQIVAYSVTED